MTPRKETHDLHGTGERQHAVYDMPGEAGWDSVTDVPCPVDGCEQTVLWYEAGYVPGYRVCMRETGKDLYDHASIQHRFLADPAGPKLILLDR